MGAIVAAGVDAGAAAVGTGVAAAVVVDGAALVGAGLADIAVFAAVPVAAPSNAAGAADTGALLLVDGDFGLTIAETTTSPRSTKIA